MISIIIPLFNKEKFIQNTIQSVLNQTFTDFELIIVNDGSTDNSALEVSKFNDKRIILKNIDNTGVSNARNVGVKMAKYKFISFLDADDWWETTFLEEIVKLINTYTNIKVFATGRCRVFKNNIQKYKNSFLPKIGEHSIIDYIEIISNNLPPINSSNVVLNKNVFDSNYFNSDQKQHEDHDLWLRICKTERIAFINNNLSFYRKDVVNSTSNKVYEPEDFSIYLSTILNVKNSISKKRNTYFKKYYNKFIIITLLKNQSYYSYKDNKKVIKYIKQICDFKFYILSKLIVFLPSKYIYNIFKIIQSNKSEKKG